MGQYDILIELMQLLKLLSEEKDKEQLKKTILDNYPEEGSLIEDFFNKFYHCLQKCLPTDFSKNEQYQKSENIIKGIQAELNELIDNAEIPMFFEKVKEFGIHKDWSINYLSNQFVSGGSSKEYIDRLKVWVQKLPLALNRVFLDKEKELEDEKENKN